MSQFGWERQGGTAKTGEILCFSSGVVLRLCISAAWAVKVDGYEGLTSLCGNKHSKRRVVRLREYAPGQYIIAHLSAGH